MTRCHMPRLTSLLAALAMLFMLTPAASHAATGHDISWGGKTLTRPAYPACVPKKPCKRSDFPNSPRRGEQAAPTKGSDGTRTQPSHAKTKKA